MNIVLLETAQRRFDAEDAWWRANRDAQELFVEEFAAVLWDLTSLHAVGQRYRLARGKLIQRWPMKKTRCHVYYLYDRERDLLGIHSILGCAEAEWTETLAQPEQLRDANVAGGAGLFDMVAPRRFRHSGRACSRTVTKGDLCPTDHVQHRRGRTDIGLGLGRPNAIEST